MFLVLFSVQDAEAVLKDRPYQISIVSTKVLI